MMSFLTRTPSASATEWRMVESVAASAAATARPTRRATGMSRQESRSPPRRLASAMCIAPVSDTVNGDRNSDVNSAVNGDLSRVVIYLEAVILDGWLEDDTILHLPPTADSSPQSCWR